MTTEIAVLNREAVALAADSAVTYRHPAGTDKVHTSANKIFALSGPQPVGITVYGAASLGGVPWETIIKVFRQDLGADVEDQLEGYERRLLAFLADRHIVSEKAQEESIGWHTAAVLNELRSRLGAFVQKELDEGRTVTTADVETFTQTWLDDQLEGAAGLPALPGDHASRLAAFIARHEATIASQVAGMFKGLQLGGDSSAKAVALVGERLLRNSRIPGERRAGLVIAGFGGEDLLPCLRHIEISGVMDDHVRAWPGDPASWSVATQGARVIPFAQGDMIQSFLTGVTPGYRKAVQATLATILGNYPDALIAAVPGLTPETQQGIRDQKDAVSFSQLGSALADLDNYENSFQQETLTIAATLPKDQLASFAEALVNLTSLRRRMSSQTETVGGPVDVAVISKGDGLVWVRRKHYFDPALNPRYFANNYGR